MRTSVWSPATILCAHGLTNKWANDSVWLQCDDAIASDGRAYAIGTTSGLAINLEECSGCGVAGWGWEDDGWGAPNWKWRDAPIPRARDEAPPDPGV